MTYIENIFLCMVSPLLLAALCMGRRKLRFFVFCIAGMGVCLLSAYINTFFAAVYQADALAATAEIAPVVEEIMKLLPLAFYLHMAADMAEDCRNLRAAGRGDHPARHLQPADCLRWCSAVHRLRPAGAAGNGGKAVCNSHITEGIAEYPLLRSRFWAALNFFVNFCILGESFPEFLYLYR